MAPLRKEEVSDDNESAVLEYVYPKAQVVAYKFLGEEDYVDPDEDYDVEIADKCNLAIRLQMARSDDDFADLLEQDYALSVAMSRFLRGEIRNYEIQTSDFLSSVLLICERAFKNRIEFEVKQVRELFALTTGGYMNGTIPEVLDILSQVIQNLDEFLQFIEDFRTVLVKKYYKEGKRVLDSANKMLDAAKLAKGGTEIRNALKETVGGDLESIDYLTHAAVELKRQELNELD